MINYLHSIDCCVSCDSGTLQYIPFIDPSYHSLSHTFLVYLCNEEVLQQCPSILKYRLVSCWCGGNIFTSNIIRWIRKYWPANKTLSWFCSVKNDWFDWREIDNAQRGPWVYWGDFKGKSCIYNITVVIAKLCLLATQSMYHCVYFTFKISCNGVLWIWFCIHLKNRNLFEVCTNSTCKCLPIWMIDAFKQESYHPSIH